jgi:hypothetical protein
VREGDEVLGGSMVGGAADRLEGMMEVTLQQDGEARKIRHWPRSDEKVETWVWVEDEGELDEL